jgi:hypothetical protein
MTDLTDQTTAGGTGAHRKHPPSASSTGKTISSVVTTTVTVGVGGYLSPLSITSTGGIDPAHLGAVGLILNTASTVATIVNAGIIEGDSGIYQSTGGTGGNAMELYSAFIVTNKGAIAAGNGGYGRSTGGTGGTGVAIVATGTFTNSGQIDGGAGGYGKLTGGAAGNGAGMYASATLINSGVIRGGDGGQVAQDGSYGVRGGYGVVANREDLIQNTGLITGGAGSSANLFGGTGGIGVLAEYGLLTNGGTILGGAGGTSENDQGATGGGGVYLLDACNATNTGVIRGGNGYYGYFRGGYGGAGVYLQTYGSIGNAGTIAGGNGGRGREIGGNGGAGLDVFTYATASNSGVINGGNGGVTAGYYRQGGAGGDGVFLSQSSFTNTGKINGGAAASTEGFKAYTSRNINSSGGDGIDASYAVITNSGVITGGIGGNILSNGGTAGSGGAGVSLTESTLTNAGTLIGGIGGNVPQSNYNNAYGGLGGAGALVGAGATLVNNKLIKGGGGGVNIYVGNTGGAGVIINGGVFINAGTVAGGYGGVSQSHSITNGDAVDFAGAGTLVAAPGAKFIGNVVNDSASGTELELTGTSSTALSGIGSQFVGINLISFASGAARVLEGSFASNFGASNATEIGGLAARDAIVLDSFTAIAADTYFQTRFDRILLQNSAGQSDLLNMTNFLAKDVEETQGGGKTTLTGLGTTATTLASGAGEFVRNGGTASGRINKGAIEEILTGGTVTATTIAGGGLFLYIGAKTTGTISFSGTGGILDIESATMPTAAIAGFVSGNTIELHGIAYNANDTVTVGTAGTVTITAPGMSYKLDIAGATKGETDFKFSAGSVLTKGAAAKPAMSFIAPTQATETPSQALGWVTDHAAAFAVPLLHQVSLGRTGDFVTLAQGGPALIHGAGWGGPQISIAVSGLDTALKSHAVSWR